MLSNYGDETNLNETKKHVSAWIMMGVSQSCYLGINHHWVIYWGRSLILFSLLFFAEFWIWSLCCCVCWMLNLVSAVLFTDFESGIFAVLFAEVWIWYLLFCYWFWIWYLCSFVYWILNLVSLQFCLLILNLVYLQFCLLKFESGIFSVLLARFLSHVNCSFPYTTYWSLKSANIS